MSDELFEVYIPDLMIDASDVEVETADEAVRQVFDFESTRAEHGDTYDAFVLSPTGIVTPVRITVDIRVEPREATADELTAACEVFGVEVPAGTTATPKAPAGLRTMG